MPPDPNTVMTAWDSPAHNYHNVRVICDSMGLTLAEKNLICACIYQESSFLNYRTPGNPTVCLNKDKNGSVWSTDWGICQINDWFHIGPKKDFPSVDFVMQNPDKVVMWMVGMYQKGQLKQWSSYSTGAYKKWLSPTSPMWLLKT